MNFASDNVYGVHPRILNALTEANAGTASSYAGDDYSKKSEERLGTAANGLALSALTPPYGAVICHGEAHIAVDECNSPEMFTGGAKILGLHGPGGKITPAMTEKTLKGFIRGEHDPKPAVVSLTNATELGTVYATSEVKAISDLIRPRSMKLHMDGARFANALVGLGDYVEIGCGCPVIWSDQKWRHDARGCHLLRYEVGGRFRLSPYARRAADFQKQIFGSADAGLSQG
jgi:threonine aldolase